MLSQTAGILPDVAIRHIKLVGILPNVAAKRPKMRKAQVWIVWGVFCMDFWPAQNEQKEKL
jgi:hypothetical protein